MYQNKPDQWGWSSGRPRALQVGVQGLPPERQKTDRNWDSKTRLWDSFKRVSDQVFLIGLRWSGGLSPIPPLAPWTAIAGLHSGSARPFRGYVPALKRSGNTMNEISNNWLQKQKYLVPTANLIPIDDHGWGSIGPPGWSAEWNLKQRTTNTNQVTKFPGLGSAFIAESVLAEW